MSAREQGFTLVEMLVALAIFSIVASVGVALTSGALAATARSGAALETVGEVERLRRALAADLGQAAPRISLSVSGQPLPAFTLTPEGFVLVRRGVTGLQPSVQKVAWGFDGSRLLRQTWPRVDGAEPGPAVVMPVSYTHLTLPTKA
jgi:general secretion pathway protein J